MAIAFPSFPTSPAILSPVHIKVKPKIESSSCQINSNGVTGVLIQAVNLPYAQGCDATWKIEGYLGLN